MVEKLKQMATSLISKWKSYSGKVKTTIISVVGIVFIALILLVAILNKVNYTPLIVNETTGQASSVASLLDDQGIQYRLEKDNLSISVNEEQHSEAILLIYGSDISTEGISIKDLTTNSLSTTNSDRTLKNHLYIQTEIRNALKGMEGIDDAQITYVPVDNTYSVLSDRKDYPASVSLTINDKFNLNQAKSIAEFVAAAIGNSGTDKIKVIDQKGNLLFGGEADLYSGSANSILEYREKLQNTYNNNIYILMTSLGYDDVESMFNWSLNMNKVTELFTEQIPAEGQEQGLYKNYYSYDTENNTSNSGGVPGTDSNDETTYLTEDQNAQGASSSTIDIEYIPSERVTNTEYEIGAVNPKDSSGSIVGIKVVTYTEEELRLQGLLDDMSFDEYVIANKNRKQVEVEEEVYTLVANATGVAEENIKILAYEQAIFIPTMEEERDLTFYIQIILAVLILIGLIFVIWKATATEEIVELEPELSVEQLLATTKENLGLEDIDFSEKSETKKMIEKFVDENPEAVAQLLRNWLNDDWG